MAIANLQEKLLFFTMQKSRIAINLSNIQMEQLSASKKEATNQQTYNAQLQELYYAYHDSDPDTYSYLLSTLQSEHEFELSSLNAWESQLELQKDDLETRLNEISSYEASWQKLLTSNIKSDFAYGGQGTGGK